MQVLFHNAAGIQLVCMLLGTLKLNLLLYLYIFDSCVAPSVSFKWNKELTRLETRGLA